MALASWPALQGQQRNLRRIGQDMSWAFARSPEARSFACALFASYVPDTASGRRRDRSPDARPGRELPQALAR